MAFSSGWNSHSGTRKNFVAGWKLGTGARFLCSIRANTLIIVSTDLLFILQHVKSHVCTTCRKTRRLRHCRKPCSPSPLNPDRPKPAKPFIIRFHLSASRQSDAPDRIRCKVHSTICSPRMAAPGTDGQVLPSGLGNCSPRVAWVTTKPSRRADPQRARLRQIRHSPIISASTRRKPPGPREYLPKVWTS